MRHHLPRARAAADVRCAVCARRVHHGHHPAAATSEPTRCALCQTPEGDLVGDLLAHRDAATAR